jgi:flagellar protein FlaG
MEQEVQRVQREDQDPEKQRKNLEEAVDKLNRAAMIFDRSLRFQVHTKTRETMVAVVDMTNDKTIREIPSKEVLDLVSKMKDYMGMIFDRKV